MWKITGGHSASFAGYAVLPDGQRPRSGTGLGLSIARNLIDQHSGKLNLPVGQGIPSSRFTCLSGKKVTFMQRGIVWVVDDDSSILGCLNVRSLERV